jgi:DNA-binding YbaB/EbfC family protein
MVSILMTGKREVRKVSIDDTLVGDDKEMLEDLVAAAINDAVHKVAKLKKEKMGDVTSGILKISCLINQPDIRRALYDTQCLQITL